MKMCLATPQSRLLQMSLKELPVKQAGFKDLTRSWLDSQVSYT